MSDRSLPRGTKAVIRELAEAPLDGLDERLVLEPMDPPEVGELSPRDVVVAVRSAAVGWVDCLMTSGQYQHLAAPPYVPGLEYAGEVVAKGPEARAVEIGDRVLVDPFLAGPRSLGDYRRWGGFASYAVAPIEAVHRVPEGLTLDQAAGLLGSYETAYHCLVTRGRLHEGETVLVHGATGATGLAAVQIAKLLGAKVIATGRSREKLEAVSKEGADHVLVTTPSEEERAEGATVRAFAKDVKALTSGRGVDVVYDAVGGDISTESLRCVTFGARFLVVGWAATPTVARGKGMRGAPNANTLPTNLIMMKGLDVLGCPTAISTVQDPSLRPPRLRAVLEWAAQGKIRPHVSHVFALSDVRDALRAKYAGAVTGTAVLHP